MQKTPFSFDARRDLFVGESREEAVLFAKDHWIHSAKRSIQARGRFAVALSGGTTPKEVFKLLAQETSTIDWSLVFLFWSDERDVPLTHKESNYHMAMEYFSSLPIPPSQIFPLRKEGLPLDIQARSYEETLRRVLHPPHLDLVLLGMGEDGHTASLFPDSPALGEGEKLVCANWIEQKKCHRLTLTFRAIEEARHTVIYALGREKSAMVQTVLQAPVLSPYPASRLGLEGKKALWILDNPLDSMRL